MIFCARPSKTFLFNLLNKKLKKIKGKIGLDVASAGFKNRNMFKTDFYYGVDIDLEALKKSVAKDNSNNTFGIYADMAKLDKLTNNSVDFILSTNTLYHLIIEDRKKSVAHLCRLVSSRGLVMLELCIDENLGEIMDIVKNNFDDIKIIYYKNIFSRFYENIFEKDGYLGSHFIASKKFFLIFSYLISKLEYLTCYFKFLNKHIVIICSNKKGNNESNDFNLSNLKIIDKNIYTLFD